MRKANRREQEIYQSDLARIDRLKGFRDRLLRYSAARQVLLQKRNRSVASSTNCVPPVHPLTDVDAGFNQKLQRSRFVVQITQQNCGGDPAISGRVLGARIHSHVIRAQNLQRMFQRGGKRPASES
jgi:hypothetical protein